MALPQAGLQAADIKRWRARRLSNSSNRGRGRKHKHLTSCIGNSCSVLHPKSSSISGRGSASQQQVLATAAVPGGPLGAAACAVLAVISRKAVASILQ
jgi:hypothetical protein